MIIKQATGSDKVSTILRQQILDPLDLDNTFLDIEDGTSAETCRRFGRLLGIRQGDPPGLQADNRFL